MLSVLANSVGVDIPAGALAMLDWSIGFFCSYSQESAISFTVEASRSRWFPLGARFNSEDRKLDAMREPSPTAVAGSIFICSCAPSSSLRYARRINVVQRILYVEATETVCFAFLRRSSKGPLCDRRHGGSPRLSSSAYIYA